jgi:hypothetical protein
MGNRAKEVKIKKIRMNKTTEIRNERRNKEGGGTE